jgi:catechol 2,3-dioxygenase-like lactoylglutathione lyase family enzyme
MYTHVMVGTNDPDKARAFYDAAFKALGITGQHTLRGAFYGDPEGGMFGVVMPRNDEPATYANGGTIGFKAADRAAVDTWYAAGMANGGADEGPPGERPFGDPPVYGAYMRDPDGNKLCAFCPPGN